jgi:cell division protein FtsZ
MGIGEASGEGAAIEAAKAAIASPLLETSIDGARGILLNVTGAEENLSMYEIQEASEAIHDAADSQANIIWGASIDNTMGDKVRVTVIATGFDAPETIGVQPQAAPSAAQPVMPNLNLSQGAPAADGDAQQTVSPAADFIDIPVWMQKK